MAKIRTANATITRLLVIEGTLQEADDLIYELFVDESTTRYYADSLPDLVWTAELVDVETLNAQTVGVGNDQLIIVPLELGRYMLRMTAVERVVDLAIVTTTVSFNQRIETTVTLRAPLQQ